jgi:hypothetical protein
LKLAKHRHASCKRTEGEIASALYGNWRSELLFALKQALKLYEFYQKQLRECAGQIEECLRSLKDKSDGRPLPANLRKRKPEKNEVRFGARELLFRMSGVDLTQIEAISETTALVILSELGTDLSAFAHEKNFVSWLGLCPQHAAAAARYSSGGSGAEPTAWRGRCGWRRRAAITRRMRWERFIAAFSRAPAARRRSWRRRGRSRSACIAC